MFTRHLAKSFPFVLHVSVSLGCPVAGRCVAATPCLQSVAVICASSDKCASRNPGRWETLLCPFLLKQIRNVRVRSSLHTSLNIRLHLWAFPADQLFCSLGKCGHLVIFDVSFTRSTCSALHICLRLFPGPKLYNIFHAFIWTLSLLPSIQPSSKMGFDHLWIYIMFD